MAKAEWKFQLCQSPNPLNPTGPLVKIGDIAAARGRKVEIVRNRAGSCSFQIPVWDDMAYQILDKVSLGDVRGTVRKCVRILRNGVPMWSGPIWTIQGSLPEGMLQIGCVGWLERAQYLILRNNLNFSNTPQDQIAFSALTAINNQDTAHPAPIFQGAVHGTMQARSRAYKAGQSLGEIWKELSDVESGFDLSIDPDTRNLDLWAWDTYTDRPTVHLGYKWGPDNLANVSWQEDASKTVNYQTTLAIGGNPTIAPDPAAIDEYGRFESQTSLPESSIDIATSYGNSEVAIKSRPLITYTIKPFPTNSTSDTPALFVDYNIGDKIYFTAHEGAFRVAKQAIRVFGASISIDDQGNENIDSLQTAPAN